MLLLYKMVSLVFLDVDSKHASWPMVCKAFYSPFFGSCSLICKSFFSLTFPSAKIFQMGKANVNYNLMTVVHATYVRHKNLSPKTALGWKISTAFRGGKLSVSLKPWVVNTICVNKPTVYRRYMLF